jgi:undecaprenyl diphosphate synthase
MGIICDYYSGAVRGKKAGTSVGERGGAAASASTPRAVTESLTAHRNLYNRTHVILIMQPSLEAAAPVVARIGSDPAPACIGIIMDGNRRWAREQGLSAVKGHEYGFEKLKEVLGWAKERGVQHLIVYAFSTENWNRAQEEVDYLMNLIRKVFAADSAELADVREKGGRLRFVGERQRFDSDIQELLAQAETQTQDGTCTLWVCLSYGGRAEILHAAEALQKSGEPVTAESFAKHLWTAGMPDPDLIIRTSGEERLSGFLPWQSVYSELFFTKTYWPAFSEAEFDAILSQYALRERRHGK